MDARSIKGIFVGKIYIPSTDKIIVRRNVYFDESFNKPDLISPQNSTKQFTFVPDLVSSKITDTPVHSHTFINPDVKEDKQNEIKPRRSSRQWKPSLEHITSESSLSLLNLRLIFLIHYQFPFPGHMMKQCQVLMLRPGNRQ